MKFLVDEQLPGLIVHRLRELGHEAVHSLSLPGGRSRADADWVKFVIDDKRIIVTKDKDFIPLFFGASGSFGLLHMRLDNMKNSQLKGILDAQLNESIRLLGFYRYVIMSESGCIGII